MMLEREREREILPQLYKQAAAGTRHLLVFMKSHVCFLFFAFQRYFLVSRYNTNLSQETQAWRTAAGAESGSLLSGSDAAVE